MLSGLFKPIFDDEDSVVKKVSPSIYMLRNSLTFLIVLLSITPVIAQSELKTVSIGVLQFGTVNWELDVVREHGLDKNNGVSIQVTKLGNKNASSIALQGGEVDIIVSDWIWVSRQRAAGKKYVFFPYSNAVGGMLVRPDANIKSLVDLKGKRLGVAGGPVDKSWLIYRAFIKKNHGFDPIDEVNAQFAAPPLLNKLMLKGDLDAVITFWKFGAKLKAAGMIPMTTIPEMLPEFGVETSMPLLGWVFDEQWAADNPDILMAVLKSSYEAKGVLKESNVEWERLRSLIKPKDDHELFTIRDTYRAGVPTQFGDTEIAGAEVVFSMLSEIGGKKLVGDSSQLAEGTFWRNFHIMP